MHSPVDIKLCPDGPGPLGTGSAAEDNWHSPPFPLVLGISAIELMGVLRYEGHRVISDNSKSADWPTGHTVSQWVPG